MGGINVIYDQRTRVKRFSIRFWDKLERVVSILFRIFFFLKDRFLIFVYFHHFLRRKLNFGRSILVRGSDKIIFSFDQSGISFSMVVQSCRNP